MTPHQTLQAWNRMDDPILAIGGEMSHDDATLIAQALHTRYRFVRTALTADDRTLDILADPDREPTMLRRASDKITLRDLDEMEAQLDGNQPYYVRELIRDLREHLTPKEGIGEQLDEINARLEKVRAAVSLTTAQINAELARLGAADDTLISASTHPREKPRRKGR